MLRSLALLAAVESFASDLPGDACLPRDVITMLRGPTVESVAQWCQQPKDGRGCEKKCLEAIWALKQERCYSAMTQPQHLQPRFRGPSLAAMPGIWFGLYPASGIELLELKYDPTTETLSATKLTGNQFIRAGRLSWEATPVGCRVVSSMWSGVYTPRWDPCTLTMYEDHLSVQLGDGEEEELTFVRASIHNLFEWDERRSPTYDFAAIFARCALDIEDAGASYADMVREWLHHSSTTFVLDQVLLVFPVALIGGWQALPALPESRQTVLGLAGLWLALLAARLRYLGVEL